MTNKASPNEKAIDTPLTPRPRTYEGKEYYGAADVAKIIGVGRTTVLFWEQQGLFTADARAHDGRYLYDNRTHHATQGCLSPKLDSRRIRTCARRKK